jgi:hypothetical protein
MYDLANRVGYEKLPLIITIARNENRILNPRSRKPMYVSQG